MAEEEKGASSWYKVPAWNGNPAEWRTFKREMKWWMASLDAESCRKYNVAARWALRQTGVVRARCEEFDPDELKGTPAETVEDPETKEMIVVQEADPFSGLNKLLKALEESMGKTKLDRRGELRQQFYQEIRRNAGERISTFCTRYRTLAGELKREGILLPDTELSWFLKDRLGLDPIRKQLLDTALQGRESYSKVEAEVLRLFRDLHTADPLYRKPAERSPLLQKFLSQPSSSGGRTSAPSVGGSSQASSSFRSRMSSASSFRSQPRYNQPRPPHRQALVTEGVGVEEEDETQPEEEELIPDAGSGEPPSLEEVLQTEAEILATELAALEEYGDVDPGLIDELEAGVEAAAESLVTMREARTRIAEVKKDRGFGKVGSGKGGNPKAKSSSAKKASTSCWDCGEYGHWGGDPQCKKPGAGLFKPSKGGKQVRVSEAHNTEHEIQSVEELQPVHEAMMALCQPSSLSSALDHGHDVNAMQQNGLSSDKMLVGALDSACNRTCSGGVWLDHYLNTLRRDAPLDIQQLVTSVPESELFRFGNGGTKTSFARYRLPMMVGTSLVLIWVSIVPVPSLGLLLGRDFLDSIGAVISFARKMLRADYLDGSLVRLRQLTAGHFALLLAPPRWMLPGALRWRRSGLAGVLECQVTSVDWLSRRLDASNVCQSKNEHEHLVTELSVQAADVSHSGLTSKDVTASQSMAPRAQAMTQAPHSQCFSTTSPIVQDRLQDFLMERVDNIHVLSTWRRMCLRLFDRARWHVHGLLLWLLQRPSLRYVPFPYPSVKTVDQWNLQADQMVLSRAASHRHVLRARQARAFTAKNLQDLIWLLFGGWFADRNACSSLSTRDNQPSSKGCIGRSSQRGQGGGREGSKGRSLEAADRSKRRSATSQGRLASLGSFAQFESQREGHSRRAERDVSTRGEGHRRERQGPTNRVCQQSGTSKAERDCYTSSTASTTRRCSTPRSDSSRSSGIDWRARSSVPRYADSSDAAHQPDATSRYSSSECTGNCDTEWPNVQTRFPRSQSRESTDSARVGLHPRRDHANECRRVRGVEQGQFRMSTRVDGGGRHLRDPVVKEEFNNPFKVHQKVKPGISQLIGQAWEQHERDRRLVSVGRHEVHEVFHDSWQEEMEKCLNETFVASVALETPKSFLQEIFTATQRVTKEAKFRGHGVGPALSLETGWDFSRSEDRKAALAWVRKHRPYFLVLAFPCGPWSPLMRLNPAADLESKQAEGRLLIQFAIQLAEEQLAGGRHFVMENPLLSGCWKLPEMVKFLEENFVHLARFDQCRFGLRSAAGHLHRKATLVATSSQEVKSLLDGLLCDRDHVHQPVLGGSSITQRAGHYPTKLAKTMVKGMEKQFETQFALNQANETMAVDGEEVDGDVPEVDDGPGPFGFESSGSEDEDGISQESLKVPAAIKTAVKRLHETTGHRSNRRLARALVLSGAPREVVHAAKIHRCSVCDERRAPKSRKPASLPTPKDVSDQIHVDIFEVFDSAEEKSYVVHVIDFASRFQMAELLEDKSSDSVIKFFKLRWLPVMGAPRVLVADQGREFISWKFEEMCAEHGILLWHCAIQAPWQNGLCERGGGILKTLIAAVVRSHSVIGRSEMALAVQEAVMSYNQDINELGVSPCQAALGRQPRLHGDVLGDFSNTLSAHGLIDSKPGLARQLALRETAKVAMARLHFSRGLKRALLAKSRTTTLTQDLHPGQVVYYFRQSKYNNKTEPSRRKLSLRRWHGPALLVAFDGHASCFVSHKGQLTKCAMEHVRPASMMEQVASGVWRDAIEDVVEEAIQDITNRGVPQQPDQDLPRQPEWDAPIQSEPHEQPQQPIDLPPIAPGELMNAMQPAPSTPVVSAQNSRRSSLLTPSQTTAAPGTPIPELIRQSGTGGQRMTEALMRARELERAPPIAEDVIQDSASSVGGQKRTAEVPLEQLARQMTGTAMSSESVPAFDALVLSHEEMLHCEEQPGVHPLRLLRHDVAQERQDPLEHVVRDHGTWKGYWPLPSRSEWQAVLSIGGMWPKGEHDALAVQTARKEYRWKEMPEEVKPAFTEAAKAGWSAWVDNQALEVLDPKTAKETWQRLKATGSIHKVLTPRYVYTDKHDGLRTESNPLPLKASARLVVPGYKDVTAYEVRKDAPTGSRVSQHLLLTLTACFHWCLLSADVKAAFLKGEEFAPGERELYICNVRRASPDEPGLPLGEGGLARLRKGIFGLADSPRRWYLRLHRALTTLGWVRSEIDAALWFLWSDDKKELYGMVLSHVDDLLVGGNPIACKSIEKLGEELGFGSMEKGKFTYCGKAIEQFEDGSISISMKAYHENLKPVKIPLERRRNPESPLSSSEQRSLRAVLGSLQWLTAQVRIDMAYPLSVLQGEASTISTLMKANALVKKYKQKPDFALWFRPMKLEGCGLMGVSDASLGNVLKSGGAGQDPMMRVYSQSGYVMMIADADLMAGRKGKFTILDGRSHRLSRVCRSTYAAELLNGTEETFDTGQYCRGILAEAFGYPMNMRDVGASCDAIPLTVVVDAKDVYDKSTSDTPSFGSQKSLAFTVAWIRNVLRRPNTSIRWTSTANMLVDCLTKEMECAYFQQVL